jgi:hypothetical protein
MPDNCFFANDDNLMLVIAPDGANLQPNSKYGKTVAVDQLATEEGVPKTLKFTGGYSAWLVGPDRSSNTPPAPRMKDTDCWAAAAPGRQSPPPGRQVRLPAPPLLQRGR